MADVEVSCEYLTSEKTCTVVFESEKAQAARQRRCGNDEKMSCCYLCSLRQNCALACSYLGRMSSEPPQTKNAEDDKSKADKNEAAITENASSMMCSSCNAKMREGKTKLRISGWDNAGQKLGDPDLASSEDKWLPVTVYLCPQCGKLEFAAEKNTKQRLTALLCRNGPTLIP